MPASEQIRRGRYAGSASPLGWYVFDLIERAIAAAGLLMLLPAMVVVGGIVVLLSRQSPLISHKRVGRFGETLWIPKLRTMWKPSERRWRVCFIERVDDDAWTSAQQKSPDDPRVCSHFARACRRFSIDEVPQLLLVATGQMSMVGPRPLTRSELAVHYGYLAEEVLKAKPGLTGMWQTHGRNDLSYAKRLRMDLDLLHDYTLQTYFSLLVRTAVVVARGDGAW